MTELYSLPLEKRVLGPMLAERAREHGDRVYLRFGDAPAPAGKPDSSAERKPS